MKQDYSHKAKFQNQEYDTFFKENGFAHIPKLLNTEQVETLKQYYEESFNGIEKGNNLWNSLYQLNCEEGLKLSNKILEVIHPEFLKHFESFSQPSVTFMSKMPGENTSCEIHRDFTTFDENESQYINYWIPLVDITEDNGALFVIPKSHKLFTDIRPMFLEWPYKVLDEELSKHIQIVYPKAGDLILYGACTLHGSLDNLSENHRPVIHGGILPKEYQIYYFRYLEDRGKVQKYRVTYDFFMKGLFQDEEALKNYELIEDFFYSPHKITVYDIQTFLS